MCARNDAKYSKESDASEDTRCFLITGDKDCQIGSDKQDTNPETSSNRLCIGKCSPNVKPKLKNHSVDMPSLTQDSQKINDIQVGSRDCGAALSMDNTNRNIQRLDEIQNAGSPPRLITICDRVLANSPSFLVLKDSSSRNETIENTDNSDLSQSESCHPQTPSPQQTLSSVIRSNAGCQTDEMCCQGDVASSNNSCHEGNDVPSARNLSQPNSITAEGPPVINLPAQLKQHTQEIQQQQQERNSTSSQAPYVTISFKPLQAGPRCGTSSVAPCQQFLSAERSSCCSFCTSNCCLPRPPQVCPLPKTPCCLPGLAAPQNLSSCPLTPYGYPYTPNGYPCCSRSVSYWPPSGPQHQSSLGFSYNFNRGGMCHRVCQRVLSTTCFAPGGSFHPGIHPCPSQLMPTYNPCSHCRINVRPHPHCSCAGLVNNKQQCPQQMGQECPQQMGQQCPQQMGQQCPLQRGQQCPLQRGQRQLPLLGHQEQCNVCGLKQNPKKATGSEVSGDEGLGRDGLSHVLSSTELPRAYGGAAQIKSTSSSTSLLAARSGRTCLILRPTATAMVPRLLTRRISRFTSVIMAPK